MVARSTWADVAGKIAAIGLPLARLFNPAACSSFYQLSGPAVWEQLSGAAVWEQLSGPTAWEQLSGPAVWAAPGSLDIVSATTLSLPGIYLVAREFDDIG
jgi:hypothetical protein